MGITFHPGANLAANPHYSRAVPISNAPAPAQPQPTSARKRQFRFSVRADIDLLQLVIKNNPYAAPHGGRLHKWQAVADTLREGGIDIDFRRARDRTGLLLDQWREQELSLLRRSASGNQEDQAQKEQLLQQISEIEQAARPRDNSADWRSRDHPRSRTPQAASGPRHTTLPLADNPSTQAALNVIGPTDPRAAKFGDIQSSSLHTPGALPPLMQKHDSHSLPQARVDTDLQTLQYGTHQGPPEKQFKNNHGQALSPRFTQPLFGHPASPKGGPSHAQPSQDRRTPPRSEMSPHRGDLPLLRPGQPVHRNNPHVLGSAPLDVSPVHAATSSPRIGEGQNIQLDSMQAGLPRQSPESETEQLRARIMRLEKRLEDISQMAKKHLEYEERRLQWEQERENKRLQLERQNRERVRGPSCRERGEASEG